ncbi:MAG: S8 family serine peptidase [Acidimicrobiia bacterium]|nr:S8 family serine peptidase [Acidimicrobiia bacterium]
MRRRRTMKHTGRAGVSWDGPLGHRATIGRAAVSWTAPRVSSALFALLLALTVLAPTPSLADDTVDVIVQQIPGTSTNVAALIEDLGGSVTGELRIIDGYAAELPASAIDRLSADPAIASVTPDGTVELTGWHFAADDQESLASVADKVTNADQFWNNGYTGAGVDIALIDSGVSPVDGLTLPNKVVNGPDLSFESQDPDLRYLDSFGHGTHLAGIMAGQSDSTPAKISTKEAKRHFLGIAPDARIVNVKVATRNGATDVSQVIAAIDWVVQHRDDNGMNIRVINLSFGTDSTQSYYLDPLAFAVEQAWNRGIVVVVAAGNDGNSSALRNPASDPFVIAVGAAAVNGSERTNDDSIPKFSSCGTNQRHVDVVAPGRSIVSLLAPGSAASVDHPEAIIDGKYLVGSGTSQAAAVVSGAAALIIDQRPGITPDQVKALLMTTASKIRGESSNCQGAGLISLGDAVHASTPSKDQSVQYKPSQGTGSLEASRGSFNLSHDGVTLEGEQDIMGTAWDGASWSSLSAAGASWSGGDWNGASWSGASWSGASWSGASWSGASWSGASWSGEVWG